MPEREGSLRATVESLASQVDSIYIALNNYSGVPGWLQGIRNVEYVISDNRLGDAHKFMFLDKADGIALICDDDLQYSPNYTQLMVDGLRRHGGVVSLHGKVMRRPFMGYKSWSRSIHCLNANGTDTRVDVVGTGVCAFDTNKVGFRFSDCQYKNMADILLSTYCLQRGIPMTVLAHPKDILTYTHPQGSTIWQTTRDYSIHNLLLKKVIK